MTTRFVITRSADHGGWAILLHIIEGSDPHQVVCIAGSKSEKATHDKTISDLETFIQQAQRTWTRMKAVAPSDVPA